MKLHSIRWMFLLVALPMVTAAAEPAPAGRKVELAEVAQSWPAEATVEAVRQATLTAQVQGRVLEVRVDAGATVKPGQLLMRLDARQAAEDAAGAEARLAQAKAQWERNRSLFEKKFISKAALDSA
ncbi:MAG TPA: biotin/lipoyl-binding protein, partial [Rhodocyclaceae bacterium]